MTVSDVSPDMGAPRWALADIDLGAVRSNVGRFVDRCAPAEVWAVVKADGYGHGAVEVGRAALAAGASALCVALVQEGVTLRAAGIECPILVLSEQPPEQLDQLVNARLSATVGSTEQVDALARAADAAGATDVPVHLKIDTGMRRMGAEPGAAVAVAERIAAYRPLLSHTGTATHFACADEPRHRANTLQLQRFRAVLDELRAAGIHPGVVHAANSAAALMLPETRFDAVRVGIALYGISPGPTVSDSDTWRDAEFRQAMRLTARVSRYVAADAGDGISYGWTAVLDGPTGIATVPIGYADGVDRHRSPGGEVLIGGSRCRIIGRVTMDQIMVDVGGLPVSVGDEVVLLGEQGDEHIGVEEWATHVGTIGYEVVCGVSARVPRRYSSSASS
jgi:alanine racemase